MAREVGEGAGGGEEQDLGDVEDVALEGDQGGALGVVAVVLGQGGGGDIAETFGGVRRWRGEREERLVEDVEQWEGEHQGEHQGDTEQHVGGTGDDMGAGRVGWRDRERGGDG